MFGDLTTVSLFFSRGWDDVTRRGDETFADEIDRRIYGVDISQVATKNLILGLSLRGHHRGGIPEQSLPPGALS